MVSSTRQPCPPPPEKDGICTASEGVPPEGGYNDDALDGGGLSGGEWHGPNTAGGQLLEHDTAGIR